MTEASSAIPSLRTLQVPLRLFVGLLLSGALLLPGCADMPVRVGIREARAAGAVSAAGDPRPTSNPRVHDASGETASGGDVVHAPQGLPQPHNAGDVVGLRLQGVHPVANGKVDVTFGEVFAQGAVPSGSGLAGMMNGEEIPAQLDVKTHYADGSARMGVVTVGTPHDGDILLVQRPVSAGTVDLAALPRNGYDLAVDLIVHAASGDTPYHFDAAALLAKALQTGAASYWLRGPLASEARVDVPVVGSLHLTFDIRGYADGSIRSDVQFNNDIAMQPVGGELHYDVAIRQHGAVVFQRAGLDHFQYQTWHREIWNREAPQVNVIHDVAAIARAGAVQNYDLTTGVQERLIADEQKQMNGPGFDILQNAGIVKYMGMTGARADIGPTTLANTIWLMTQNATAAKFALAQADAAGSIPWHYFDASTHDYVTLEAFPKLWTDGRGGKGGTTGLTQPVDGKGTGWALDAAHQPDLSYVPYVLTGTRYYLDQLDAQAVWCLVGSWPVPREFGKGIVVSAVAQVRSQAWSLRELVEAAFAVPDDSALKHFFRQMVGNNFVHFQHEIETDHEGEAYGWKQGTYGRDDGAIAPWQQDYLATTVILAAGQGVPGAKDVLIWQSHYLAGRFLSEDVGLPPYDGAPYNMVMYAKQQQEPYQTWREIEAATIGHGQAGGGKAWPTNTFGTSLRAARGVLAGIFTITDSERAAAAFNWLTAHAPQVSQSNSQQDPTWNIVPLRPMH